MTVNEAGQGTAAAAEAGTFVTDVPARLDRLPWSRFHWLVVTALGITWILDGLEVKLVGSLSGVIASEASLGLSATEIGLAASSYVAGAVLGALYFGHLADRLGRKRLFTITVGVYALATILSGLSWDFFSFALFRFLTGAGIGGEYSAINSAIQELIPARRRGYTDLAINGSFWIGAALGALSAVVVLDPALIPADRGWRLAFVVGGVLALVVIVLRRYLPESPRWLMTHGRPEEAERVVAGIERRIEAERGAPLGREGVTPIRLRRRPPADLLEVARTVFVHYSRRALLGVTLMTAQAFLYNAIFFTYALVLTRFYDIQAERVGWFVLPFALGNVLGPLVLGRLFDSIGRKPMITITYALSGVIVAHT
jgi:MFS family permease